MASEYRISPQVRDFLKSNGCTFLSKNVENMSYHDFITTPSWNLASWGASLEIIRNHAKLAYEAYQAHVRVGFVGIERKLDACHRGRSGRRTEGWTAAIARSKPVEDPVRKSRAQVLGDRCCNGPRRDHIASCNPPDAHHAVREPSPDTVYRTKTFF